MINKLSLMISLGIIISSCTYAQDKHNSLNIITRSDVKQCKFDYGYVDFCSDKNLMIYNQQIKNHINFSDNKILSIIEKEVDFGKGIPRRIKYIVVIDPKLEKVYPLDQYVGYFVNDQLDEISNQPPLIDFKNNKVCLSGTTFSKLDNNVNVKNECYTFSKDGNFTKDVKKTNINGDFPISSLPYSSKKHVECVLNEKKNNCGLIKLVATADLVKKYNFINVSDGGSVILPPNNQNYFYIISPFDDGQMSLRVFTVKGNKLINEKIIPASKGIIINGNGKVEN